MLLSQLKTHYRRQPNGATGNNPVLNDESGGHSMEYIRHLAQTHLGNEVEKEDGI